ncbi:hypothetical protein ACWT_6624 [Actinoplanes sp. SE50]|nr:hypothetical protein ACPL_6754 [Actinoplanes sp. SE50/110]ATO86039.1 hypothetical protein ACWT_6624 [Actinoplanes sp. SE50]SLM03453.1 hypothetical protein ACSP50_6742 [Actinoplanes sp. SE50/110]
MRPSVLIPIAAALALAGCSSSNEPDPATAPVSSAPVSSAPVSSAPVKSAPVRSAPTKTAAAARGNGCPVTAATLNAVHVPDAGDVKVKVVSKSIKCADGYAQADPGVEGSDGVFVYRYDAKAKAWRFLTAGSSIDCGAIAIPRPAGDKLSVCYYQ